MSHAEKGLACPLCQRTDTEVAVTGLYDDRYGFPGRFALRRCPTCNHRYLDATFTSEELAHLYTTFYPRRQLRVEQWRPAAALGPLRTWLGRERSAVFRWVPLNVAVLDVGCGFGESVGYHRSRGCRACGIDPDENVRRVAEAHGLDLRVGLFRAADYPANAFDYVTLDQVIEHAADPIALLRDAAAVARPGGRVLVATPNGDSFAARRLGSRWVHAHTPYHLQLFSARSLAVAATTAGLNVREIRYLTNPKWYAFQWMHLLARRAPGQSSPFWSADVPWPRRTVPARKLVSALGHVGLNHLIAGVLDALQVGDNLVAVFEKPRE